MTLENSFLPQIHFYNALLVLIIALVAGIWGLVLYFSKREMIKPWRIMLIITLTFGLLQGLLGVIMVLMGLKPGNGVGAYYLHYVYGGIVALGIPFVWLSFTSNEKNQRRVVLYYSLAALVMVAAGVRGLMTGLGMP